MAKISNHNKNLEEIGIDEEGWYRIWYDLYHNSIRANNPTSPTVMKHYTNIPQKHLFKFMRESQRKQKKV